VPVSRSSYKFIAVYIRYEERIQTTVSIFVILRDLVQRKRVKCVVGVV